MANRSPEEIKIKSILRTIRPESTHTLVSNNLPLALGFSKILYETAIDCVPSYFDDEFAIRYSKMLYNGQLDISLINEVLPQIELIQSVNSHIYNNLIQATEEHLAFIAGYPNIGLIGFIKIFDLTHVMILSRDVKYYEYGATLVSNNFKEKKLGIYTPKVSTP